MNKNFRTAMIAMGLGAAAAVGGAVSNTLMSSTAYARANREVTEARASLAATGDLSTVFKVVDKAVEPSVVQIQTKAVVMQTGLNVNPFRGMFPFGGGEDDSTPQLQMEPRELLQQGTGSGVIMQVDGSNAFILTNNHVVDHAKSLTVTLADGRQYEGSVVGTDPRTDLAVVKIKADNVIAANWGDSSQLEKGDWVIAFGSPLGYVGSMTHGIVSALNRTVGILGQAGIEEFIQTDAPINPGNSGGPLVNTRGEVVGINSCIASQTGGSQGIGFAVPEKLAKPVFEHLKADGKVTRGWLGVAIADVSTKSDDLKDVVASTGFKGEKGILVSETVRSSPAYGVLEPSDVITAVNGKGVTNLHDFRETIASFSPGTEVKFSVFRAGKTIDVSVKLGNQPEQMEVASAEQGQRMLRAPRGETSHGMTLRNLTENGAKQFGFDAGDEGALVVNVQPNSAAARAGLKAGDLITSVNGTPVKGSAEAAKALKENDGKSLRLSVTNAEGSRVVVIREK